jgi:hypothetical protein
MDSFLERPERHDRMPDEPMNIDRIRRYVRVIAILDASNRAGLAPVPVANVHLLAYLVDALSPVWGLRILDAQLLRRGEGPISTSLQSDIDRLVGMGIVRAASVGHLRDSSGTWRLQADYQVNERFTSPILEVASSFPAQARELSLVDEVVLTAGTIGRASLIEASQADAAYSDLLVDIGGLVDLDSFGDRVNRTAQVALRFGQLLEARANLSNGEMTHLYLRELENRVLTPAEV